MTTHGCSRNWPNGAMPEYRAWLHIRGRCRNPKDAAYRHYGGRGITFSSAWDAFADFLAEVGPRPSSLHTLERIDNERGYEPGNCTWATRKAQARNRRSTRTVMWNGKAMSLAECCEANGASYSRVHCRLQRGWGLERAITAFPK